jgi:cytochrome c oxidase assembly factor CtaG
MYSLSKSILLLLTLLVLALAAVTPVLAHGGTHGELWQRWAWQDLPWLLLIGGVYALGLRTLWARAGVGSGISRGRAAAFGAGMIVLFIAVISPLDALSEELFAAHMVQHLLLILVAAPLFVIGRYTLAVGWAFPARWNARVWKDWKWKQAWSFLTRPMTAFLIHNAAIWLWHMPRFYEAALNNEWLHFLEHASFFLTAFVFWQVFADLTQNMHMGRAAGFGLAIFLVFGTMLVSGFLGVLLTFSQFVWYPLHIHETALYGLTALEDQQLAGTIMWVPAGVAYAGLAIGVMGRWLFAMETLENPQSQ